MEQLSERLQQLGLGDYEARVYSVLLRTSPASATLIAKQCALSRSSVYTTLSTLISKGLVGTTYKNDVKQFVAEDYASLEQLLKKERAELDMKFKTLDAMRTTLQQFSGPLLHLPSIVFFEGQEGLKKVYLSMMRQARPKDRLYLIRDEFIWQPEWQFVFEQEWHARIKRIRIEKNITTKLLINPSAQERSHEQFYKSRRGSEHRYLPKQSSVSKFALYILGDVVSVLSTKNKSSVGLRIANRNLADNFKQLFEGLWQEATKR